MTENPLLERMKKQGHDRLLIGGEWREASDGAEIEVLDPSTGEPVASVPSASVDDVVAAVDAAEAAAEGWAATPPRQRGEILRRAFEMMIDRSDELASLIVLEMGKTFAESKGEIAYAAEFYRWFSEEAVRNDGSITLAPAGDKRIIAIGQPIGVSLLITPWNFPAAMATRKIGPALAAGCTVVLKPASDTPLTAVAIADLMEPAGGGAVAIPSGALRSGKGGARGHPVAGGDRRRPRCGGIHADRCDGGGRPQTGAAGGSQPVGERS